MARKLIVDPNGWPCKLQECPPGHFVYGDSLCFKTEYGELEVYNGAGEAFWGGAKTKADVGALVVQPVTHEWIEDVE